MRYSVPSPILRRIYCCHLKVKIWYSNPGANFDHFPSLIFVQIYLFNCPFLCIEWIIQCIYQKLNAQKLIWNLNRIACWKMSYIEIIPMYNPLLSTHYALRTTTRHKQPVKDRYIACYTWPIIHRFINILDTFELTMKY